MQNNHEEVVGALLARVVGEVRSRRLFEELEVAPALQRPRGEAVSRAELAQAVNMLLFEDVVRRVPTAAAYVGDARRSGRRLVFDHGALRTVAADCGALPRGFRAFERLLEPLGFELRDVYPLERLGMTGRAYAHRDFPEDIAQFFVSELHPEQFSGAFQQVVQRVIGRSRDPLPAASAARLEQLQRRGSLPFDEAAALLPDVVGCFDRHHDEPAWSDYQALLAESKEMAWIATEGNAFNHATDRVADVQAVADAQRLLGRPVKERVEVSASGRVRQTAFRAAEVERLFVADDGALFAARVPGSFHEFISREEVRPGVLDLRFDSSNAAGIFKMTSTALVAPGKIGG